jgi:hypothetical protein
MLKFLRMKSKKSKRLEEAEIIINDILDDKGSYNLKTDIFNRMLKFKREAKRVKN